MKVIFCCDPQSDENPDPMYIDEVAAATRAGIPFALINYEALTERNNAARAVRDIPVHKPSQPAVYRGWPLRVDQYRTLYEALLSRGIQLMNTPQHFQYTQFLPESLPLLKSKTPHTVWMETDGNIAYDSVMQLLIPFSGQPLFLRDYARSEKHYWNQACYIASASDASSVRETIENFLKLRGDALEGGLVFREYIDFELLTDSHAQGKPPVNEYRIFYLNTFPLTTVRYWNVPGYDESHLPDLEQFNPIARRVRSRFFTMDVARRTDDEWMILDLGDAQIAPLPVMADLDAVYRALAGVG